MLNPLFIDWITIHQYYPDGGLPVINRGQVFSVDSDGSIEWQVEKAFSHEGSFESRIHIQSDGYMVRLSGNVSRFNRPDNLFGFDLDRTLEKTTFILAGLGLPPFSAGHVQLVYGHEFPQWTGAVITRLDLTKNYILGNRDDLKLFMNHLASKSAPRVKTGVFPDGATVDYGRGSKYLYHKAYDKFLQWSSRGQKHKPLPQVLAWVEKFGLLRHEVTLKSRFLTQNNLRYLGALTMKKLCDVYNIRGEIITAEKLTVDDLNEIPAPYCSTAAMWRQGVDITTKLKKSQYYKHRKALLAFGIDISRPCNIADLTTRIKHRDITITAAIAPEWYWELTGS